MAGWNELMQGATPSREELDALVVRYEWFSTARIVRSATCGVTDRRAQLLAALRGSSSFEELPVDAEVLRTLSPEDFISRFLREGGHRIVAEEGEVTEEVRTEAEIADEDDLATEELAEIYRIQGLNNEAIAIYRRLSLLNPEKSVYFAELIDQIEKNN